MSVKDKFNKKMEGFVMPIQSTAVSNPDKRPKTGPGQLLAFRNEANENTQKIVELEIKLEQFNGSHLVKKISPEKIFPSKWINRHSANFDTKNFELLKEEIASSDGNVQPIKVRPLKNNTYEIVYGHRRYQACKELDLDVLCFVESIDDLSLFIEMDRENRQRADLTPWEQGTMYNKALDSQMFPSIRQLAKSLGIDQSNATKYISLARLPEKVINTFSSPLAIKRQWITPLSSLHHQDEKAMIKRAESILEKRHDYKNDLEVFEALTNIDKLSIFKTELKVNNKRIGEFALKDGCLNLKLAKHILLPQQITDLSEIVINMAKKNISN